MGQRHSGHLQLPLQWTDAEAMVGRVAQRFATENPPWVKWLEDNIGKALRSNRFARSAHRRILHRAIDPHLERSEQGGPSSRTRVVGIFPNEASVLEIDSRPCWRRFTRSG